MHKMIFLILFASLLLGAWNARALENKASNFFSRIYNVADSKKLTVGIPVCVRADLLQLYNIADNEGDIFTKENLLKSAQCRINRIEGLPIEIVDTLYNGSFILFKAKIPGKFYIQAWTNSGFLKP